MPPLRRLAAGLSALLIGACTMATPFRGPGPASAEGVVTLAVTRATLGDDPALRARFWENVARVEASLAAQPGFLGFSKRTEILGDTAWTLTAWADRASLDAFVQGPAHRTAMREANAGLAGSRFVRYEAPAADWPPRWDEALARLSRDGRAEYE